jgi:hypothetical protein
MVHLHLYNILYFECFLEKYANALLVSIFFLNKNVSCISSPSKGYAIILDHFGGEHWVSVEIFEEILLKSYLN